MEGVCDAHIHWIPGALADYSKFYRGPWTDRGALGRYLEEYGIRGGLVTYPTTDADADASFGGMSALCQIYNAALEDLARDFPQLRVAGLVDLTNTAALPAAIRSLKDRGMAAVSVASSYGGRFLLHQMHTLLEAAEACSLPIVVHPQTINPIGFERVQDPLLMPVLQYPLDVAMCLGLLLTSGILSQYRVKFLFSSLGGVLPYLRDRLDRVYTMLRSRDMVPDLGDSPSRLLRGIYVDTAGSSLESIRMAIDCFGTDRLLWGSDHPVSGDVSANLGSLRPLGPEVHNRLTHGNFQELFGL